MAINRTLPPIPRVDDSDPQSAIDYARLGSDIEHSYTQEERGIFFRKFWQTSDSAMADLAVFCRFKCEATAERLAGRLDAAQLADVNAQTIYDRNIKPENQW